MNEKQLLIYCFDFPYKIEFWDICIICDSTQLPNTFRIALNIIG